MAFTLRPYQERAIEQSRSLLAAGLKRICIVAPTGAGKTVLAASIIKSASDRGSRVLFLAHRRELIDQASGKLTQLGVWHGVTMSGHPKSDPAAPCQVGSVQTVVRRLDSMPPFDVIFVDETHLARAKSYTKILDAFPNAVVLGLTATPWRLDGKGLGKVYEDIVVVERVSNLIRDGFLVQPRVFAPVSPNLAGVRTTGGDYNLADLAKLMDQDGLTGDIVRHYHELTPGRPAVVFASSVQHSLHLADRFKEAGYRAEHVDGKMRANERTEILARFRSGETQIVSNVDILTEGFDLPRLEVCILARPTQSSVKYLQCVGRVLRPAPGKREAIILDHAGCTLAHGFASDDRQYTLADVGKPKKSDGAKVKVCPVCFSVQEAFASKCTECGTKFQAPPRESIRVEKPGQLEELFPDLRPSCSLCGSNSTRVERPNNVGSFTYTIRCLACGASTFQTDKHLAKGATSDEKRSEYQRLNSIAMDKGFKPGWAAHQYREIFGVWPRFAKKAG